MHTYSESRRALIQSFACSGVRKIRKPVGARLVASITSFFIDRRAFTQLHGTTFAILI